MPIVKCDYCGKEFKITNQRIKRSKNYFCSIVCRNLFQQKGNIINVLNDHAEIVINSKKYGQQITLIDLDDVKKVQNFTWCVSYKNGYGFYVTSTRRNTKCVQLHRLITNCPDNLVVDHINHNTLDNRKSNLRNCTNAENTQNTIKPSKNNKTSGILNVYWDKKHGKWSVKITFNKKRYYGGGFTNLEEAKEKAVEIKTMLQTAKTPEKIEEVERMIIEYRERKTQHDGN